MLVQCRDICKSYQTLDIETRALRNISLEIETGDYVSIEGPSGCGKSTLLSVLGLLDTPTTGTYSLAGRSVEQLPMDERSRIRNREIGFIFQNFNLIGDLSIYENIELPLVYRGMAASERKTRVQDVLRRVSIAHRQNHYPMQLSGGEQQRAAVARALVGRPSLLLADEPTGNLDTKNGEDVMALLDQLHSEGATIIMVTHDATFAKRATRSVGLLDGRLVSSHVAQQTM